MSRARGYGPTLAGSGRCTSYIDETICTSDEQCLWKPKSRACALKPARKVIGQGAGRGQGSHAQKAAAKANPWIAHVKKVQAERGISYKEAMKVAGASYKKMTGGYYW